MPRPVPRFRRLPVPAALARPMAAASLLLPGLALANPSGGTVVAGSATINSPAANKTVIDQGSNAAVINWQQFNIGGNEYVQFVMPSSSSVVLNRVIGGSPAQIFGDLSANGRVFLIDPQGVLFGRSATLNVGGLFASTMNIGNQDFMSGNYVFSGGGSGAGVINGGHITTPDGGFVVLAGDYVRNTGVIQARLGQVVLASGSAVTMDMNGSGLISFAVDQASLAQKAGVDNAGQILADGGRVLMTAETAHSLIGSAVNNSGLIQARGISSQGGEIELTASGGDVTDSGTLDVSSAGGAGGTVQIGSDRNIDLQQGAQILASGSQGGSVSIVADGTLNTRAGSLIQALGSAGPGGFAELSGHGSLTMRGGVSLGRGGTLLLDPTNLTIAAGSGASSSATVYQSAIQSQLQGGTNVQLVASNSIATNGALSNGLLNGSNNGKGGNLLIGIGTLSDGSFLEGNSGTINLGSNSVQVDGSLSLYAGGTTGSVTAGNLTAGSINVNTGGGGLGTTVVSLGNLSAAGNISIGANYGGNIQLGSVSGGSIYAYAGNGGVTTQALTAAGNGPVSAGIYGYNGAVVVNGPITASSTGGNASVSVSGNTVSLQGVSVSGVGSVSASVNATNSITVSGAINVSAQLARSSYSSSAGKSLSKTGDASISLSASNGGPDTDHPVDTSTITTNGLSASGPNANISVSGGTLTLNNAASGAPAVSVNASGAFYTSSQDGATQVTSNFGYGGAQLQSDNTAGPGNAGITSGSISVSGPAAAVVIGANNDIKVNGGISVASSNTMGINGSTGAAGAGYTVLGNADLLPAFGLLQDGYRAHCCNSSGFSQPFKLPPLLFNSGSLQWGNADIAINGNASAGNSAAAYAGNVAISGNVSANGLGESSFNVYATSLSVGGGVSITAGQVALMGAQQSFVATGTSSEGAQLGYTATRTISNGAGGAATYGRAHSDIEINGGNASLGSLTLQGYSDADANINGAAAVTIAGNVAVSGNTGGGAAVYDESVSFADTNGGTGINTGQTYDTHVVGGQIAFGVDFNSQQQAAGSFSAAGISLAGYGLVGSVISAGTISAGAVNLTQLAGSFASNDPTRTTSAFSVTNPGVVLGFFGQTAQAQSIGINAAGPAALGLDASINGAFDITAGSLSGQVPAGVVGAKGPIQQGIPNALASSGPSPAEPLPGIDVSAGSASLNLGAASSLAQLVVDTSGALSINAGGQAISAPVLGFQAGGSASFGNVALDDTGTAPLQIVAGGTLNLNAVSIGPGTVALGGNGGVGISGSSIDGTAVQIGSSAGSVNIAGTTLAGQSLGITAATGAALNGDTYSFSQSIAVGSNAGQVLINNNLGTAGVLVVAGGSVSAQNLSGSSVTVADAGGGISTGAITATGASGVTIASTGGAVSTGNITGPAISATAGGGNASYGGLNSSGAIDLVQNSGNLSAGNVSAAQFTSAVNTGNEQVGNVSVSGNNLFFGLGDIAGQTLQIGNIGYGGTTPLSFNYNNASLTVGNVSASGFGATLGNGNLATGNIIITGGNIGLTATHGSLTFGNLSAAGIAVSTGQALSLSGNFINASGSFTLATGGNASLNNVQVDAGSASLTSGGSLSLGGTDVQAASVTLNGAGGITVNRNSLIGQSSDDDGLAPRTPASGSSVALTGGNVLIDGSTLQAQQLTINGGNIQFADASTLSGGIVTLTGTGLINATGGASTISASGLAVSGNTIDFSDSTISVGSGVVSLGSDPTLLQQLQAKAPGLLPASSGPNAAFAAAGGVSLGQISVAGGYLFLQSPTLALPTVTGGKLFVDYLPSNPQAPLNINLTQQPTGIATLVFGGSPQTGAIDIGNGSQKFVINSGVNLVFASSGATYYPDAISSNAQVVVLGASVLETVAPQVGLADIPLVPTDYQIDAPPTGALAYSGDQDDVNAPGVNNANKGLIDIQSGPGKGLSCGIGGAQ